MTTPIEVRNRLREIRRQQGLTLKQVEIRSRGTWKAVVVGSYERGSRTLSFGRAAALCDFYGVPLSSLVKDKASHLGSRIPLIIDLQVLRLLHNSKDNFLNSLSSITTSIIEKRQDWNGHLLSIRSQDIETLALMNSLGMAEAEQALLNRSLLFREKVRP